MASQYPNQTAPPPYAAATAAPPPQAYAPQQQQYVQQQPMMHQPYVPGQQTQYVQQPAYIQQPVASQTGVVVVQQQQRGNCPTCRNGFLVDDYTALGIILAILFFPLGIICCLILKERRCTACQARF